MKFKSAEFALVVFDIGNTIVDAEKLIEVSSRYAAERMHSLKVIPDIDSLFKSYLETSKSLHHKHINRIFSDPLICARALTNAGLPSNEHNRYLLLTFFRKRLRQALRKDNSLISNLKTLKAHGLLLAALSDGTITEQYELLDRLGVLEVFDHIRISEAYGEEKSSVNIFSDLLQHFALNRYQALMVGDDLRRDMQWASKAGYRTALQEQFIKHSPPLVRRFAK